MSSNIKNFVIIAHIDHGKSTLADRMLELTGTVEKRKMREQFLDMHPLERERGITIKMQPVRMVWSPNHSDNQLPVTGNYQSSSEYILNLIDTPGHVDFSYEVSRALAAVEGAVLLVDATQGIQAQTISNLKLAEEEKLTIIPAVNKIDLPSAEIEKTIEELSELLKIPREEILRISGKTGSGIEKLLEKIIAKIPPPHQSNQLPVTNNYLRALIFDSLYDPYQGIIAHIRVVDGAIKKGDRILCMATGEEAEALEVGVFYPERAPKPELAAGEIGYIATGIKDPASIRAGDTITGRSQIARLRQRFGGQANGKSVIPLPGYKEPEPMVFASLFPEDQDAYELLRESLKKLKLNDAALRFEPEDSSALGRGFRTGFLGMLHMEIVSERLRREYRLAVTFTNPSVAFTVKLKDGEKKIFYSAAKISDMRLIESIQEPWVQVEIITPSSFLGPLTALINEHQGTIQSTAALGETRLRIEFESPLREIIIDFYDKLKSISHGFASMSYRLLEVRNADLVRLDLLVAGEKIFPLSEMVPRLQAYAVARARVEKLKEILPRELFQIAIQAEIESKIIARETISALRKDVTGYLYGGDRTRKMKLWKKQQKGKKKLKERGRVEIPPEVYLKLLRR